MERILVAAWALLLSTPIDVQAAGADRGEVAQPSNGARAEAWDDLAQEFELAFAAWAMESMGPSPDAERAPSPALAFWPRFEVLAAAGEGRAVVWQIAQLRNFEEEREARAAILFERVRAAGTAPWVSMTYHHLVDAANGLAKDSLREYVAEQSLAAETQELRVALLLMRAALDDDPARSRELELQAAAMRWQVSSRVTSASNGTATPPSFSIRACVSCADSSRRSTSITRAPSRANRIAVARPLPMVCPGD